MFTKTGDTEPTRDVDNSNPITTNSDISDVAGESTRKPSLEEKLVSRMCSYSKETICFIFAIIFGITFAALHNAPPRISKSPSAKPFFSKNSVIIDFYKGQLGAMIQRAADADVSFVMYYAPWDAESQEVRHEFEKVAHHYHSQIFFSAINCWHPGSECKNQYNKIHSYPVLVLYPQRGSGVQYKGIKTALYMIHFLRAFLKPLRRIFNKGDLKDLQTEKDAVLVGFFDFHGLTASPGYKEFYRAAIRALEKDPNQDVIFAVVTDVKTATHEFGVETTPSARLYLWNETLVYPQDEIWSTVNILKWTDQSTHKIAQWLQPPGVKSSTIGPYLRNGPVILLFTPRNPLHSSNANYDLLREIALEFHSCRNHVTIDELRKRLQIKRQNATRKYSQNREQCLEILNDAKIKPIPGDDSISNQHWINKSCCAMVFMNKCLLCKRHDSSDNAVCSASSRRSEICSTKDVFNVYNSKKDIEEGHFCCENLHKPAVSQRASLKTPKEQLMTSMINEKNDPRSAIAIRMHIFIEDCRTLLSADEYHDPIFVQASRDDINVKLSSSACNMNRSLAFVAIDSLQYLHFTEGLDIDILRMRDKTAVVILDYVKESQYLMPENLNRKTLVQFLNNYTNGTAQRTLRSDTFKRSNFNRQTESECSTADLSTVCIPELNTNNFLKSILNPEKDVVVMFHSTYCAFCSAISYVFLTVARLLSKVDRVLFVRIDGDNNDLPWQYTMNRYPSILFFPAKRKEDSTIFSTSLPVNIPNLLNFVLANVEEDTHVEALVNICHIGAGESAKNCVARIRRVCLDIIENYLGIYRKLKRHEVHLSNSRPTRKQREILYKLEHIRDIHLFLSTVEDLSISDHKYQQILQKFHTYNRNIRMFEDQLQMDSKNGQVTKEEL